MQVQSQAKAVPWIWEAGRSPERCVERASRKTREESANRRPPRWSASFKVGAMLIQLLRLGSLIGCLLSDACPRVRRQGLAVQLWRLDRDWSFFILREFGGLAGGRIGGWAGR